MYRPEGWETLRPTPHRPDYFYGDAEPAYIEGYQDGVEAGADAMLEGLRAAADRIAVSKSRKSRLECQLGDGVKGYLVFIPDEK